MQHSNHRTAALIASKPARIITSAAHAVALTATPMLSPVAAFAASQATQDQLSAAQKKIEDATSAYNDARTKLEDLQKQSDSNEANIDKIEAELPEQQAKASSAMRDLYKYQKGTSPIVSFLVNTQSLGDFITTCKYTRNICKSAVWKSNDLSAGYRNARLFIVLCLDILSDSNDHGLTWDHILRFAAGNYACAAVFDGADQLRCNTDTGYMSIFIYFNTGRSN